MAPTKTVSDNLKRRCPLVRVKPCILKNTIDNLSVAQKQWVADTGLGTVLMFDINEYPEPLSYLIADSYKLDESSFYIEGYKFSVSENDVHEILGLPKGDLSIDYISNYEKREAWKSQFSDLPRSWAITASDVCDAMKLSSVVDMNFKLNFLIIMSNVLIKGSTTPYLSLKMLGFSGDVDQCFKYNWCKALMQSLNECFAHWCIDRARKHFTGSIPFCLVKFPIAILN